MRETRNPFRLNSSERIESDATFVHLYSPEMLEVLGEEPPWSSVHIVRSGLGGGKTSLMRLLTPSVLLTLHAYRTTDECKTLYERLRELGAVDPDGPRLLGVFLSCARTYASLSDLDVDPVRRDRLFFALLNARAVIAGLRGALVLRQREFPDDLRHVTFRAPGDVALPPGLDRSCDGRQLFDWASSLEAAVGDAIDSYGLDDIPAPQGHDSLFSLDVLRPDRLQVDGAPVAEHVDLLLDNVHKLAARQRSLLLETLIEARSTTGVWLAERFEALSTDEMLSSGATEGRDYARVVPLERFWRERTRRHKFETLVLNIGDRRVQAATDVEIGSFASTLPSTLDGPRWQKAVGRALEVVSARVRAHGERRPLFDRWIADRDERDLTPREKAHAWRALEILIERENRRGQARMEFMELTGDELRAQDDSGVRAAAELFLSREFGLPYYFGPSRLAQVASSNIEQFLLLAGDQFEEVVGAALLKRTPELPPDRQEALLKKAGQSRLDSIPRRVKDGMRVRAFVEAIGRFSRYTTYQPNAPYDAGVNGIAISMSDRENLLDRQYRERYPGHAALGDIIATCLAHNILEAQLDYRVKDNRWMVLYLNRLLCVHFDLPLHYGGFREKGLAELTTWSEQGFVPPRQGGLL